MNSTVDAGQFAAALKKVGSVVPTKTGITELKSVLAEFSADTCRLTGTDLNDWLSVEIPARGDDFAFTIPYQSNLGRLCKRYSGKLLVDLWGRDDKQKATLVCTDKASEFPVNGVGFFPARPSFEAANEYVSNAAELYDRVKSVSYASQYHSTKPELDGIRFEGNHVWCLDGQRMAVSDDKKLHVQDRFILPAQSLEYLKLFGNVTNRAIQDRLDDVLGPENWRNQNVRNAILTMRKEVMKIPYIKYSKYSWNPAYKGVDDYFLSRVAAM